MNTLSSTRRRALVALALLAGLVAAAPVRAVEPDDLRKRALDLNTITGTDPLKGQMLILLKDPAGAKKLLAAAVLMVKEKPQPFARNATLILATVAAGVKEYDAGETFYRLHAEQSKQILSDSGVGTAYSGLTALLFTSKKYAECEKLCREFLELKGDESLERTKSRMLRLMILSVARQGNADKAVELVDRLIKKEPDSSLVLLDLKGRVLREVGKLDEAVKAYEELTDKVKNEKRLKKEDQDDYLDEVRYSLSGVYVELNQIDKAAEQLKALLAREPNNPTYNNDLGYIWADHDMNLEESEKLVRKAIEDDRRQRQKANPDLKPEDDKDNPAYLDSLGWVLYKQKKYKEARPLLEQAVKEEEGRHIEIYDHLAEVCLALGDKAAAVAAWKKGVEVAGSSKREQDRKAAVEKKIKANP